MTPREIRFGLDGLTGMVVISVGAALAMLTWTLAGYAASDSPVGRLAAYVPPAPPPDLAPIIDLPPFGRASSAPVAAATSTTLTLHGILLANPATASTVLIAASGQDPVEYRVGQTVPGGGIVDMIAADYVLLRNGAQPVALYFPDDQRAGQAAAPGTVGSAPSRPASGSVDAIRALLPPSVTGVPNAPVSAPSPPPPPSQNVGPNNGLIDTPPPAVTPRQ